MRSKSEAEPPDRVGKWLNLPVFLSKKTGSPHRHELYRLTNPERLLPLLEEYTPVCLHGYRPDLSQYDRLTTVSGTTTANEALASGGS